MDLFIKILLITLVIPPLLNQTYAAFDQDGGSGQSIKDVLHEINYQSGLKSDFTSINGIISAILPIMMTLSGIVLLFMLISGGFTMFTAVSDPKAAEAGKQRITTALIGFLVIFVAYWLAQILEIVLGITILG